jgi:uncharacterized protein (DUF849 family)
MSKVFLEAALNGPWGRERQPNIPLEVEAIVREGVIAAKSGAAIIHVHAYDSASGRQQDDWQIYARIIEGIRAKVDAIVYPTIPVAGSGYAGELKSPAERYAHLDELGRRGLVDWGVADPGSVNFARFSAVARGEPQFVYLNPDAHFFEGMRVCAAHGVRPSFAIYEPGHTRLGAARAAAMPNVPTPIYRLMFSDEFAWGFPPKPEYLDAHLALLAETAAGAPFMIAGLGVDVRGLIAAAVERGGHVRVGLEDARWGAPQTNRALVEEAVRILAGLNRDPASAAEVRATCATIDLRRGQSQSRHPKS